MSTIEFINALLEYKVEYDKFQNMEDHHSYEYRMTRNRLEHLEREIDQYIHCACKRNEPHEDW